MQALTIGVNALSVPLHIYDMKEYG